MKTVILYIWNLDGSLGKPFGVFTDKKQAEKALAETAEFLQLTVENLKADLYYYELPLNKLVDVEHNIILS